jgi:hypothetical protein
VEALARIHREFEEKWVNACNTCDV